ncbi:winged helix-turn-helix domain-containing protein [Streptomyces sp. NPDC021100]|uniref:winged helix-turn-helix domain-containing protein n=1 Tax=Streptomyces sp. NPDC021100 TaxID=3365114 RepID=UPI0037A95FED
MSSSSRGIPPYQKIAAALRDDITAGRLGPGTRCPSERQLARQHKVARATARAAIRLLRDEGLLATEPGRGTFVRTTPSPHTPNTPVTYGEFAAVRYTASTINDEALDALYAELALLRRLAGVPQCPPAESAAA